MAFVMDRIDSSTNYSCVGVSSWPLNSTSRRVVIMGDKAAYHANDRVFTWDGPRDTYTPYGQLLWDHQPSGTSTQHSRTRRYMEVKADPNLLLQQVSYMGGNLFDDFALFYFKLFDAVNGEYETRGAAGEGVAPHDSVYFSFGNAENLILSGWDFSAGDTVKSNVIMVAPDQYLMVGYVNDDSGSRADFVCAKVKVVNGVLTEPDHISSAVTHNTSVTSEIHGPPTWGAGGVVSWWTRDDSGTDILIEVDWDGKGLTLTPGGSLSRFTDNNDALEYHGSSAYNTLANAEEIDVFLVSSFTESNTFAIESGPASGGELRSYNKNGYLSYSNTISNMGGSGKVWLTSDVTYPVGSFMNQWNYHVSGIIQGTTPGFYPNEIRYVYVPPVIPPEPKGFVYGPACAGQAILPQGSGHTLEIDQTTGLPIIRDPNGDEVDLIDNPSPVPGACSAPVMLVARERLLYVYYGGRVITSYLIPESVWDALPAETQVYLGYVDKATGDAVNGPEEAAVLPPRPVGYAFQAGTYTASMGSDPYLWSWAQDPDRKKDILVTGSTVEVVETPTQTQIDAADKAVLGGRSDQPFLTMDEAYGAVIAYGSPRIVEAIEELTDPPAIPTGLSVTVTDGAAALSWDEVADTRYAVYWSTQKTVGFERQVWPLGQAELVVENGVGHWFKVAAIDITDREGTATAPVYGVYPIDVTPTAAPANPTATVDAGALSEQITFSWDAVAEADHYRTYTATSSTGPWSQARIVEGATSTVYKSLQYDTEYFFEVVAVDASGNVSPRSATVSDTTVGAVAPTGLAGTAVHEGVDLVWDAGDWDDVTVYYSTVSASGPWTNAGTTSGTSLSVTGLTNGVATWFTIDARFVGEFSGKITAVEVTPEGIPDALDSGNLIFRLLPATLTVSDGDPVTSWVDTVGSVDMVPTGTVTFSEDYFAPNRHAVSLASDGRLIGDRDVAFSDTYSVYFVFKSGNVSSSSPTSLYASPLGTSSQYWYIQHRDGASEDVYIREGSGGSPFTALNQPADVDHIVAVTSDSPGASNSTQIITSVGELGDLTLGGTFSARATGATMSLSNGSYRATAVYGEIRYYNVYHDSVTRDAIIAEMEAYHNL